MGVCCCCVGMCCFNNAINRSLEIALIVLNSISFVLLLMCLIIIDWKIIYNSNLYIFIIMFIINLLILVFIILIRYWSSSTIIKTTKKDAGSNMCTISIILSIILLIGCSVEDIVLSISFNKVQYPCLNYSSPYNYNSYYYRRLGTDIDCEKVGSDYNTNIITVGQYLIAYATINYTFLALILEISIWCILRTRILAGLDGPAVNLHPVTPIYPSYGQAVVVIQQPGYPVQYQQNAAYVYNQELYSNSNPKSWDSFIKILINKTSD